MFWILWFFIAFIIVLVAFTLRKETEEMPRREILRAVESTGGMGISERASCGFSHGWTHVSVSKIIGTCPRVHITTCTAKCH